MARSTECLSVPRLRSPIRSTAPHQPGASQTSNNRQQPMFNVNSTS